MRVPPMLQASLLSDLPFCDCKQVRNPREFREPREPGLAACAPSPGKAGRVGNLPVPRGAQVLGQSTKRQSALLLCISTLVLSRSGFSARSLWAAAGQIRKTILGWPRPSGRGLGGFAIICKSAVLQKHGLTCLSVRRQLLRKKVFMSIKITINVIYL